MDPLSVIASITGILTSAAKISTVAATLISVWREALDSVRSIVAEMSALRVCLAQLHPFIQGTGVVPRSRKVTISLEQIVIVTSSCILTIAELEKTLDSLKPDLPLSKITKFRWMTQEKRLNSMLALVRASTNSLNLILTIITCC